MGAIDAISMEAREVLLEAVLAVAWADQVLAPEERQAARAAAMGLGLVLPGDGDLTSPDREPVSPAELVVDRLSGQDKELIYLCASWMAFADEVEVAEERSALAQIRARFEISDARAEELRERARTLRDGQGPGSSWWRAFDTLVVEAARALREEREP